MKKVKELLKNKKVRIILIAIVVVLIAVVGIICFTNRSNENKLNKTMKELGKGFYEEFYWPQVGKTDDEKKEFLKKYADTGIKVNLDNLGRYSSENEDVVKSMVNKKTKEECDKEKTRVIIYPKDPYGKSDYKMEVELVCGFDKDDEEKTTKKTSTTTTTTTTTKTTKKSKK